MELVSSTKEYDEKGAFSGHKCIVRNGEVDVSVSVTDLREHCSAHGLNKAAYRAMRRHAVNEKDDKYAKAMAIMADVEAKKEAKALSPDSSWKVPAIKAYMEEKAIPYGIQDKKADLLMAVDRINVSDEADGSEEQNND